MEIEQDLQCKLLAKSISEGRIYFFCKGVDLGGGIGTGGHPHICIKTGDSVLVLVIVSSQVKTTRENLLRWGRVKEVEVPIILKDRINKLWKEESYVECYNAYECSISDFTDTLKSGNIKDTGGCLSDIDLLVVLNGVLQSDQVPEEIKDRIRN